MAIPATTLAIPTTVLQVPILVIIVARAQVVVQEAIQEVLAMWRAYASVQMVINALAGCSASG